MDSLSELRQKAREARANQALWPADAVLLAALEYAAEWHTERRAECEEEAEAAAKNKCFKVAHDLKMMAAVHTRSITHFRSLIEEMKNAKPD